MNSLEPATLSFSMVQTYCKQVPGSIETPTHLSTAMLLEKPLHVFYSGHGDTKLFLNYRAYRGLLVLLETLSDLPNQAGVWSYAALLLQFKTGLLTAEMCLYAMQFNTQQLACLGLSSYCDDCIQKPYSESLFSLLRPRENTCYLCGRVYFPEGLT